MIRSLSTPYRSTNLTMPNFCVLGCGGGAPALACSWEWSTGGCQLGLPLNALRSLDPQTHLLGAYARPCCMCAELLAMLPHTHTTYTHSTCCRHRLSHTLPAQAGTLTPKDPSAGMLTLTGWSAALGIMALLAVAVGGAVMAYRRYKGWDQLKGYTIVQKDTRRGST